MNLLILDDSTVKAGDTITLKIGEVLSTDGGFAATVSQESETPAAEEEAEEPVEEMPMMEEEGESKMSPAAKKVLGKK